MMFLKKVLSRHSAENILSGKSSKKNILKKVELVYLPYYLFKILLSTERRERKEVCISADGISGNFSFFTAEKIDFTEKPEGDSFDFVISRKEAEKKALEEYRWLLIKHSFTKSRLPRLETISETSLIYYPYWVGYYERGGRYDFRALDGISGEFGGIRMREVFLSAFRQTARPGEDLSR